MVQNVTSNGCKHRVLRSETHPEFPNLDMLACCLHENDLQRSLGDLSTKWCSRDVRGRMYQHFKAWCARRPLKEILKHAHENYATTHHIKMSLRTSGPVFIQHASLESSALCERLAVTFLTLSIRLMQRQDRLPHAAINCCRVYVLFRSSFRGSMCIQNWHDTELRFLDIMMTLSLGDILDPVTFQCQQFQYDDSTINGVGVVEETTHGRFELGVGDVETPLT